MRVLIAGGSGLIGGHIKEALQEKGHDVYILTRKKTDDPHMIQWDLDSGTIDDDQPFDAVINLAGAGIVDRSWTEDYKRQIVESRVGATEVLDAHMQRAGWSPDVYINASAIGIYGHHPTKTFTEDDTALHSDFLVITCEAWEQSVEEMSTTFSNQYIVRIGVVLSEKGGAFPQLSVGRPFGVVAHLGNGQQYLSWIHMKDLVGIFLHLLAERPASGVYNAVAPEPVTNKHMSRTIAATGLLGVSPPVPEFMVNLILGKRKVTVLNSTRVSSQKIEETGYNFHYSRVADAVGNLIKRMTSSRRRPL